MKPPNSPLTNKTEQFFSQPQKSRIIYVIGVEIQTGIGIHEKMEKKKKKPKSGIRIAVVKVGPTKTKTKKRKKERRLGKWDVPGGEEKWGVSERPRWNWFGKAVVVESMRWGLKNAGKMEGWVDEFI